MRDPFELVEFAAYLIGVGLVIPAVAHLRDYSETGAAACLLFVIFPLPAHLWRLRSEVPERVEKLLLLHIATTYGLAVLSLAFALFRWLD